MSRFANPDLFREVAAAAAEPSPITTADDILKVFKPISVLNRRCTTCLKRVGYKQYEFESILRETTPQLEQAKKEILAEVAQSENPPVRFCNYCERNIIGAMIDKVCACGIQLDKYREKYAEIAKVKLNEELYWKSAKARLLDEWGIFETSCRKCFLFNPQYFITEEDMYRSMVFKTDGSYLPSEGTVSIPGVIPLSRKLPSLAEATQVYSQ